MTVVTKVELEWREWRLRERRYKGYTGPRPAHFPTVIPKEWWDRLEKFLAKRKHPAPAKLKPQLIAQVIDISHANIGHPWGKAFASQADKVETRIQLLFGQGGKPEADALAGFAKWAAEWRAHGVKVDGWFRGSADGHAACKVQPPQPLLDVDDWMPDYENEWEAEHLALLENAWRYSVLTTLGKAPLIANALKLGLLKDWSFMFQSFRDSMKSDQHIAECVRWWTAVGVPLERLIAMIQAYQLEQSSLPGGVVPWFEPPVDQARTAIRCGLRRLSIYPLPGSLSPTEVSTIAGLLAEAA